MKVNPKEVVKGKAPKMTKKQKAEYVKANNAIGMCQKPKRGSKKG